MIPDRSENKTNAIETNRLESRSIDLGLNDHNLLRSSLAETAKRKVSGDLPPNDAQKRAQNLKKAYASMQQSASRRSLDGGGQDVALKDMLDVPD